MVQKCTLDTASCTSRTFEPLRHSLSLMMTDLQRLQLLPLTSNANLFAMRKAPMDPDERAENHRKACKAWREANKESEKQKSKERAAKYVL